MPAKSLNSDGRRPITLAGRRPAPSPPCAKPSWARSNCPPARRAAEQAQRISPVSPSQNGLASSTRGNGQTAPSSGRVHVRVPDRMDQSHRPCLPWLPLPSTSASVCDGRDGAGVPCTRVALSWLRGMWAWLVGRSQSDSRSDSRSDLLRAHLPAPTFLAWGPNDRWMWDGPICVVFLIISLQRHPFPSWPSPLSNSGTPSTLAALPFGPSCPPPRATPSRLHGVSASRV